MDLQKGHAISEATRCAIHKNRERIISNLPPQDSAHPAMDLVAFFRDYLHLSIRSSYVKIGDVYRVRIAIHIPVRFECIAYIAEARHTELRTAEHEAYIRALQLLHNIRNGNASDEEINTFLLLVDYGVEETLAMEEQMVAFP